VSLRKSAPAPLTGSVRRKSHAVGDLRGVKERQTGREMMNRRALFEPVNRAGHPLRRRLAGWSRQTSGRDAAL
jgi:hypothetical protein